MVAAYPKAHLYCKPFLSHPPIANCAKSFVTGDGVERVVEGYVAPEVGLPWLEWIKQ